MAGPKPPGAHALRLAVDRMLRAAACGLTAAAGGLVALGSTGAGRTAAVVLAVAAGAGARHFAHRAGQAWRGAASERAVARAAAAAGVRNVLNGVRLSARDGDADHVLIGPCLAVVETKTGSGPVTALADGRLRVGVRVLPGRPLRQVVRAAAAVGRQAGTRCEAIVCVPGMTNTPFRTEEGVWVCSTATLATVVAGLPRLHLDGAALARRLAAASVR